MSDREFQKEMREAYRAANLPRSVFAMDPDDTFPKAMERLKKLSRETPVWFITRPRPAKSGPGNEDQIAWRRETELWGLLAKKLIILERPVLCVDSLAAIQYAARDWTNFLANYDNHYLFLEGFSSYAYDLSHDERRALSRVFRRWQNRAEMVWVQAHEGHSDYVARLRESPDIPEDLLEFHRGGVQKLTAEKYV